MGKLSVEEILKIAEQTVLLRHYHEVKNLAKIIALKQELAILAEKAKNN